MEYTHLKCPNCGAPLAGNVVSGSIKCEYCDSIIDFSKNMSESEKIKKMEIDEFAQIRKEDLEQDKLEKVEQNKSIKGKIIATVAITLTCVSFLLIGALLQDVMDGMLSVYFFMFGGFGMFSIIAVWEHSSNKKKKSVAKTKNEYDNLIEIDDELEYYHNSDYAIMRSKFEAAGFKNVKCISLNDLNYFTKKRNGTINSITVDGNDDFESGEKYDKNVAVVITYHSTK